VFYGLDWIATVPPTVALARQAFGAEKTGLVFGWIMASHQIGAALAASFAGLIRTTEGSYDHAFLIAGGLCLVTAIGVLFAGRGNAKADLCLNRVKFTSLDCCTGNQSPIAWSHDARSPYRRSGHHH